eukprot:GHUV01034177.1.p1 GENE.GHUV01034177.1~~GHUV01034177.1.p1  ORF type:complete len:101 (+),score=7.85 GHUV01034177.1:930-1232(+)
MCDCVKLLQANGCPAIDLGHAHPSSACPFSLHRSWHMLIEQKLVDEHLRACLRHIVPALALTGRTRVASGNLPPLLPSFSADHLGRRIRLSPRPTYYRGG